MSYATRRQVAVAASVSRTSQLGARVAVARLADAARVEQRPALAERDRVARPVAASVAHPAVDLGEGDRDVGVAVQAVRRRDGRQAGPRERRRGDVLPGRVARAAVDEREAVVDRGAAGRAASQVAGRLGDRALRVHSIAARASGLNQSISRRRRAPPRRGCRGRRSRRARSAGRRPRRAAGP